MLPSYFINVKSKKTLVLVENFSQKGAELELLLAPLFPIYDLASVVMTCDCKGALKISSSLIWKYVGVVVSLILS